MTDSEMSAMVRDVEIVARYGLHANVFQLIGICEEREVLYVVLESGEETLKKTLLDSRALVHNPGFARKNRRVSTLTSEQVFDLILGVARGMEYLGNQQVGPKYWPSPVSRFAKSPYFSSDLPSEIVRTKRVFGG